MMEGKGGMKMECNAMRKKATLILTISGEIDHHTSKIIRERADRMLAQIGGKNIIFQLRDVDFMDSSGIGMMIGRYKRAESLGGRVAILQASETIQELIRLSGLSAILKSFANMEDALEYVEGRDLDAEG